MTPPKYEAGCKTLCSGVTPPERSTGEAFLEAARAMATNDGKKPTTGNWNESVRVLIPADNPELEARVRAALKGGSNATD